MYNGNREQILREQGIEFTVMKCDKCGEYYEPYEPHTCHGKNSYILKEAMNNTEPIIPLEQAIKQVEEPKSDDMGERVYRCYKRAYAKYNGHLTCPLNVSSQVGEMVGSYLYNEFADEMYERWLSEGNKDKVAE